MVNDQSSLGSIDGSSASNNLSRSHSNGYDIIGDIHGCAQTLVLLLERLGYDQLDGVFKHPSRKAIFVGDVIDRGPRIRESLKIVKSMVDAGYADCILGNHEFNAVAYTTVVDNEDADPRFLRKHDTRNNRLIHETLIQFAPYPEEWREYLDWFKTLPLFNDYGGFRVVHACWHDKSVARMMRHTGKSSANLNDILPALASGDIALTRAMDRLTRGTSLHYPDGRYILSRDGIKRTIFRTKFWAKNPQTYQDVVFQPDPLPEDLSGQVLNDGERDKLIYYPDGEKPVFIGHYWLQGRPQKQKSNVACLDYSAVKYGRLVAYRWDGESTLSNDKFVWVYVDPDFSE